MAPSAMNSIESRSQTDKKLLVLDVEGTVFKTKVRLQDTSLDSTIWQGIAPALGPDAIEAEIATHRRWEQGYYSSYLEWMTETIEIHKSFGLKEPLFRELIDNAEYNAGVAQTLAALDRETYEPVLVSGGFRELAKRAQVDLGIRHAFAACEYFFGDQDTIVGHNLLPCDFEGKTDFIELMLREYQLPRDAWVFVGDGRNDVPIAQHAPLSVAYGAHSDLQRVSTYSIEHFDKLLEILSHHLAAIPT